MPKKYSLPKEFAEKWVAALRGGEYEQTQSHLQYGGAYCCLGVACRLVGAKDEQLTNVSWIKFSKENDYSFKKNYAFLKRIPDQLIGIRRESNLVYELSSMNDNGKTFAEIADWIIESVEFTESGGTHE